MMGVINPVGDGAGSRGRWAMATLSYGAGLVLTGPAVGAGLALPVALLPLEPGPHTIRAVVAALSLGYGLHELRLLRLPSPQRRRQVPEVWRRRHPLPVASFLYGSGLGVNLLTHISTATLYVVVAGVVLLGDPLLGALVFGAVALGRWLVLLPVGLSVDPSWPRRLTERFLRIENRVHVVSGIVLVGLGTWGLIG